MNWKNIRSLFVVDDKKAIREEKPTEGPDAKKEVEGNTIVRATKQVEPRELPATPSSPTGVAQPLVNDKFVDYFFKILENNDQEGVDYLEFKKTLKSFAAMPMNEDLRFQSALTAVKSMGADEAHILQSAQKYLKVLEQEEAQATQSMERKRIEKIDGQRQRIEQLKAQAQQKAQLIKEIQTEIEGIQKEIDELSSKVEEDRTKLETKYNQFIASYNIVVKQIQSDITKIETVNSSQ